MSQHWLSDPAAPLLAFGAALGVAAQTWIAREEIEQLNYTDSDFDREVAAALTLDSITPLTDAFGDALTCNFLLEDLPVLNIAPGVDEAALDKFRLLTQHSPTVKLDLSLDKARLIKNWLGEMRGCRLFLYLFPGALEPFLTGAELRDLESRLWGKETASKVILLVPNREIWLHGPSLALLGGEQIGRWREVEPRELPDAEVLQRMYQTCRDNLKWQESWLEHLTPLHLKLKGQAAPEDSLASALRIHLANLVVLYTADRTAPRTGGEWRATYAGAKQSVDLTLGNPGDLLSEDRQADVASLLRLLEWAYRPEWSSDRLPLVQIGVVEALQAHDLSDRYELLLRRAANIYEGLEWHWKAFIESKLEAYADQVRDLEDYVGDAVQAFADQVSAMIKSLSDTMLAAVGALLGSFIAALFKDEFNPTIFVMGMVIYAIYVLVFPLGYNMSNHWGRYWMLVKAFKVRRRRFDKRLYRDNVSEIVGTQVADSKKRFQRWFAVTVLAYLMVVILAFIAMRLVPGLVTGIVPPPTPTPGQ